jgi:hypothetical protein
MHWLEVTRHINPHRTDTNVDLVLVWPVELQHIAQGARLRRRLHRNASKAHHHLPMVHCDLQWLTTKPSATEKQ